MDYCSSTAARTMLRYRVSVIRSLQIAGRWLLYRCRYRGALSSSTCSFLLPARAFWLGGTATRGKTATARSASALWKILKLAGTGTRGATSNDELFSHLGSHPQFSSAVVHNQSSRYSTARSGPEYSIELSPPSFLYIRGIFRSLFCPFQVSRVRQQLQDKLPSLMPTRD